MHTSLLVRHPSLLLSSSTLRNVHASMAYMQSKNDHGGAEFLQCQYQGGDIGIAEWAYSSNLV